MKKGKFVVFEGIDGSGKATQVKLLSKKLKIPHEVISFPRYGNNPHADQIKKYLKGELGKKEKISPYEISLEYAGDRALAKSQIAKWLKDGKLVIADRYVSSSKAHLGAQLPESERQKFINWLDDLEYETNNIPREDLVIFLYIPPEISQKNITSKEKDILEKDLEHQKNTGKIYLELAKNPKWVTINCIKNGKMRNKNEINKEIRRVLIDKLNLKL